MTEPRPSWERPQPKRTLLELRELIALKREELEALETEAFNLEHGPRLDAIAKIRNLMRAHELTMADILGPK